MATRKPAPAGLLVLDSSCWLEVLGAGLHAGKYEAVIAKPAGLLVPIITVYEVNKYLRRVKGEAPALRAAHYMEQGKVIDIDWAITLAAAGKAADGRQPDLRDGAGTWSHLVDAGCTFSAFAGGAVFCVISVAACSSNHLSASAREIRLHGLQA